MASHHLEPSVKACQQGNLQATLKPAPTAASGDAVTIDTARGAANAAPDPEWLHTQCAIQALHPMMTKKHFRV